MIYHGLRNNEPNNRDFDIVSLGYAFITGIAEYVGKIELLYKVPPWDQICFHQ